MKILTMILCMLGLISCTSEKDEPVEKVNYHQLIKSGKAIGLDVRSVGEYEGNGSLKAKNIPVSDLPQKFDELDKDKTILVFCESGGRASRAKSLLEKSGFSKVVNIKDWRAWNKILEIK